MTTRNTLGPWLLAHVGYAGDDCLKWPGNLRPDGRGQIKWRGTMTLAHRQMCVLAHGEPPEDKPEATHSCGNGHLGCVNPKHLRWGSDKDNKADMLAHGTRVRGEKQGSSKLTTEQVLAIRIRASTTSQYKLAREYGVRQPAISRIVHGLRWSHV